MRVLGIDPGLSGGAAILETSPRLRLVDAISTPTILDGPKRRLDVRYFLNWVLTHGAEVGFIERAQAMPSPAGRHLEKGEEGWSGAGASSAFIYGRVTGAYEATTLCAGVRLHLVEASVWKRQAGLIVKGQKRTPNQVKEASRQLALRVFRADDFLFQRKSDHNRAEAALIARHGTLNVLKGPVHEEDRQAPAGAKPSEADVDVDRIADEDAREYAEETRAAE